MSDSLIQVVTLPEDSVLPFLLDGHRPSWDELFLAMADLVRTRATCRAKVGCVVTRNNQVLATGYNGSLPGQPHCTDVGCDFYGYSVDGGKTWVKRCKRTIHAEKNAIAQASVHGISLEGATWYTTPFPVCEDCGNLVMQTRPAKLVFPDQPAQHNHSLYELLPTPILESVNAGRVQIGRWRPPSK